MTVYLDLTRAFNAGGLRAILSSGQAVVLHRLAVMSKDGDWILRESEEALGRVREELDRRGARYRFGAPLDVRWMRGGWSAHFEYATPTLRVRTDFVTRPPRIAPDDLVRLWEEQRGAEVPCVDVRRLIELKKTNRERDYAVIGELARRLTDARARLLASRSARDLLTLAAEHPGLAARTAADRPLLCHLAGGAQALEVALDAERRALMHAHERRLAAYQGAARAWRAVWSDVEASIRGLPLREAHPRVVDRAVGVLPFEVPEAT